MASNFASNDNASKILALFAVIFLTFIIFLSGITNVSTTKANKANFTKKTIDAPLRGTIYSRDGKILSQSFQKYYLAINGKDIKEDKIEQFSNLLAFYTKLDEKKLLEKVKLKKRVVLLENIDISLAQDLKYLSRKMDNLKIFKMLTIDGKSIRRGLEISKYKIIRSYPYKDLMEPVLGYLSADKNTKVIKGIIGIENSYNEILQGNKEGILKSKRDALGNIILNTHAKIVKKHNGSDIVLTINSTLQKDIENLLDEYKKSLQSDEILAIVMDSQTGDIYAIASSKRYNAKKLKKQDIPSMKISAIQHLFEPGSIIKPFIMAMLLEEKLINIYSKIDGHNGRYKIGKKLITDAHVKKSFSAEEAIYYSSNIAMAQMAQKLSAYNFNQMMQNFGFTEKSNIDISYEQIGKLPTITQFKSPIVKATASYGYGFSVNLMQILKAFNVFNNNGKMVDPKLVRKIVIDKNRVITIAKKEQEVISQVTAKKILKILRKTVTKGTGKKAMVYGVYTAGKTGTAHTVKKGVYADSYHSSFLGFANDLKLNKKYTIGVLAINPKKEYFASKTAVPIFKECVEILIKRGWLRASK